MNTPQICIDCVINKMKKFAINRIPQEDRKEFITTGSDAIINCAIYENPIELEAAWERVARVFLNTNDPHFDEKKYYQGKILDIEDELENTFNKLDDFSDYIRFILAGNIIDLSAMQNLDINLVMDTINKTKGAKIDPVIISDLKGELARGKHLVYLLDNVGEVVFDKIFIKKLKELFPELEITAIASDSPISSDVTYIEARELGLDRYCKVISNGNDITGTYLPKCNKETIDAINRADLIISKGMANFESLIGSGYNIYYVFLCKCEYYANILNVPLLTEIFQKEGTIHFQKR